MASRWLQTGYAGPPLAARRPTSDDTRAAVSRLLLLRPGGVSSGWRCSSTRLRCVIGEPLRLR
eukprot:2517451-Prymnesium_polylepis.1